MCTNYKLTTWWQENQSILCEGAKKRTKLNTCRISDISTEMIGSRVEISGIISVASVCSSITQSGQLKRVIEVVDPSGGAIEITIFGESAKSEYNVGSSFSCIGTVSAWNGISLTTNGGQSDEKRVGTFDNILQPYTLILLLMFYNLQYYPTY